MPGLVTRFFTYQPVLPVQDELTDAVLLVFANKQDLPNAMNVAEITEKLGLSNLRQRKWYDLIIHRHWPV